MKGMANAAARSAVCAVRAVRLVGAAFLFATIAGLTTGSLSAQAASEPPAIAGLTVDGVGPSVATLEARIKPNGPATNYRFEYGPTSSYGNTVPAASAIAGAGTETVTVSQPIGGLTADTVYHYRVIATSAAGTTASEDTSFSTFGVSHFAIEAVNQDGSPDRQAGSHPYEVSVSLGLPENKNWEGEKAPAGATKDFTVDLPPGLIGDPRAVPQCPDALLAGAILGASACPPDTQVGLLHLNTPNFEITLPVYNMVPPTGMPAQFGVFALIFPIMLDTSVRPGDFGLRVSLSDLSQVLPTVSTSFTLWGVPADPGHDPYRGGCINFEGKSTGSCPSEAPQTPFVSLPTNCGSPLTIGALVDSWEQPGALVGASATAEGSEGEPLGLIGCDRLRFDASIGVQSDDSLADTPMGLTVDVNTSVPDASSPVSLAKPSVRTVALTLPEGVSVNPAAADGLSGCSPAQIALLTADRPSCPDSSKIGTAEIDTPLLADSLAGSIYLATPSDNPFGTLLAAYLATEADDVSVKLPLRFSADPSSGRLSVLLEGLPELPFGDVKLSLHGGPRAVLASPNGCGTFTTNAMMTPYSAPESGPPLASSSDFEVTGGCTHAFTPTLTAGTTNVIAGAETGFVLRLDRPDAQQYLSGLSMTLSPGLLAKLGSVPVCASTDAATGACAAATRIGSVVIAAGAGSHPLYLDGQIFLTGPYRGAPFGLSIVVLLRVGPFDLGTIVLRAAVSVGRRDLLLTVVPDPLPQIISGIPLRLRSIDLTIDRRGFLVNPTGCRPGRVEGTAGSAEGAVVALSSVVRMSDCRALRFSPRLTVSVSDHSAHGKSGVGIRFSLTTPVRDETNIDSLAIDMHGRLHPRLGAIQAACPISTFRKNPAECPSGARIGRASLTTPMLASTLDGPAYLVSVGGRAYPQLIAILQGEGLTVELDGTIKITNAGVIETAFAKLPDAPIQRFVLELTGGPRAVMGSVGPLCARRPTVKARFRAQSGARIQTGARVLVDGCAKG